MGSEMCIRDSPGVGLGGLVPRTASAVLGGLVPCTESAVLGGLLFTSADYCDFRTHEPHMRIDDLSAPSGDSLLVFLHPSPPSIAAPAAGGLCLQPTTIRFGLRRTYRGRHGLRRSPCCRDGRRSADSFKGVLHRGLTRSRPRARPRPPLPRLAPRCLRR